MHAPLGSSINSFLGCHKFIFRPYNLIPANAKVTIVLEKIFNIIAIN